MENEYKCPKCDKQMQRKPILWGMPTANGDFSRVIIGGDDLPANAPKYGFECQSCHKAFMLQDGQLVAFFEEEEDLEDDTEDKDEIAKIDDDIQTLEMLDFFDDDFI